MFYCGHGAPFCLFVKIYKLLFETALNMKLILSEGMVCPMLYLEVIKSMCTKTHIYRSAEGAPYHF